VLRTSSCRAPAAVFEKFWKPLLLAKLGPGYRRVSAVFIWSYIRRLFSARHSTARRAQLGHVSGGYKRVFEQLQQQICTRAGGEVLLGVGVKRIEPAGARGMRVVATDRVREFDKVIFTAPVDVLRATTGSALVSLPTVGGDVEYLGVVCTVLVTRAPLVPYYVLNIADSRVPFTGVIGMSNVVDPAQTAGLHLTYLPKYVLSDDPYLQRPDADVRREALEGVQSMFPHWSPGDLVGVHVNRATRVQPLQVIGYSSLVPAPRTRHEDLYVLNTSQLVGGTLNNNEVIGAVNGFFATHGRELGELRAGASTDKAA
jgi:protoporphyrinogen oxidase